MIEEGRVITVHGRHYGVELADGARVDCFPRGKKSDAACGDWVSIRLASVGQGVIEHIHPRKNLLYRSNEHRRKLLAANVDQIVIVVATEPAFHTDLVTRALVAAEHLDIAALIVLNKCDLADKLPAAEYSLETFRRIGYAVVAISALRDAALLRDSLVRRTSLLIGQSGMGKSTLLNALAPSAQAATREISTALDTGKHTTTHTTLYHLDTESHLIDSPGLQEFGLEHLDEQSLEHAFVEFRPFLGKCRFRNCRHDQEPGCAIQAATANGLIDRLRLTSFLRLTGRR